MALYCTTSSHIYMFMNSLVAPKFICIMPLKKSFQFRVWHQVEFMCYIDVKGILICACIFWAFFWSKIVFNHRLWLLSSSSMIHCPVNGHHYDGLWENTQHTATICHTPGPNQAINHNYHGGLENNKWTSYWDSIAMQHKYPLLLL